MAGAALGQGGCCGDPVPDSCNQPWRYLDGALSIVGRLTGPVTAGPMLFPDIKTVIGAGSPVCIRIGWYGGGGHFVVISGFQEQPGIQTVNVDDPFYGSSVLDYNTFCTAYHNGQGAWTNSYPI